MKVISYMFGFSIYVALIINSPWAHATQKDSPLKILQRNANQNEIKLLNNRFRIDHKIDEITLLFFRRRGSAPVILIRPDGSKMYATQGITGEVEWHDDMTYDIIKIKQPMPGPWQAVGDILADSKILVLSNIELDVDPLPKLLFKGETIKLTGRLTNGGEPITSGYFRDVVTLDVDFVSTNNSEFNNFGADTVRVAEFKDDGTGFDEYPGDAIFTGEFKLSFADGQWRPEFYLITPLVERKLVHETVIVDKVPYTFTLQLAEQAQDDHILSVKIDESKVQKQSVLFQGKIFYPNNEEQSFSVSGNDSLERKIKIKNYDWGRYTIEFSSFGTDIYDREYMIKLEDYLFNIDNPEPIIQKPLVSEPTIDDSTLENKPKEENGVSKSFLIGLIIVGNLGILLIGWLMIRIFVQKKGIPFIGLLKRKDKKTEMEIDELSESPDPVQNSSGSDDILNLSMPEE